MFLFRPAPLALAALLLLPGCQDRPPASAEVAATADPARAVLEANRRFAALRAFHAEMTLHGAQAGQVVRMQMDFVAPDRYRLQTPKGTQTIIGSTLFLHSEGRMEQLPLPPGLLDHWRSPLPSAAALDAATVEDRGPARLGEVATRAYRVHGSTGTGETVQYWLDAAGLPVQIQRDGFNQNQPYRVTLRYSRLDDPTLQVPAP